MENVIYKPRTYRTRSFLSGRGRHRSNSPLPGVNADERSARRAVWMRNRSEGHAAQTWSGQCGFVGALVVLLIAMALSFATSSNALERAALAQQVEAFDSSVEPVDAPVIRPAAASDAADPISVERG